MKKIKCVATSLVFIVVMSNIVVGASAIFNTSQLDILIVQVGQDDILEETCSVLIAEIQNRNLEKKTQYEQAIMEMSEIPDFPTLTSKVNLQKLANENHILTIKQVVVSISELEDGILEKYQMAVLILVGHGTPDGLSDEKEIMTWAFVQKVIEEKDAAITFIASCYSEIAAQNSDKVYGFTQEIDFEVAAYVILYLLFGAFGENSLSDTYYNKALDRFFLLLENPELNQYLGFVFWNLSFDEAIFGAIAIAFGIMSLVLPLKPDWKCLAFSLKTQIIMMFTISAALSLFLLMGYIAGENVGTVSVGGLIAGCIQTFLDVAFVFIYSLVWWKIAGCATAMAIQCSPIGWIATLYKVVTVASFLWTLASVFGDAEDPDTKVSTFWG